MIDMNYEYRQRAHNKPDGNIELIFANLDKNKSYNLEIIDHSYNRNPVSKILSKGGRSGIILDLAKCLSWYYFSIRVKGFENYEKRFSGKVETGVGGFTDPAMGQAVASST